MVGLKEKFRLIWVYPAHVTFAEGMFAQPLISAYQQRLGSYAIWCKYSHGHMRTIMGLKPKRMHWLGLDWSGFDTRIPAWLIRDAFAILRKQINWNEYEEWGKPTHPGTLERLWDACVHYFINTPAKFPDGHVEVKCHGVPSGSYFTSIVDSVCSSIMKHYLFIKERVLYSRFCNWEMGDDGLTAVKSETVDLQNISSVAFRVFGAVLNTDKTELGNYVSFLGYRMSRLGYPLADYDKLVAQLLLPSRPDVCLADFASRARALQLSCFVVGCPVFFNQVQKMLTLIGHHDPGPPNRRSEYFIRLEHLCLDDWPSVDLLYRRMH